MSRKALSDWIRAVKGSFQISTNPDLRPYWPHGPRPSQELLSTARFKQEKVSYVELFLLSYQYHLIPLGILDSAFVIQWIKNRSHNDTPYLNMKLLLLDPLSLRSEKNWAMQMNYLPAGSGHSF